METIDPNPPQQLDSETAPWVSAPTNRPRISNPQFNVSVRDVRLLEHPATLEYQVDVGPLNFTSTISYGSVPDWQFLNESQKAKMLGALIAWDAMRFLALGGERIILPPSLRVSDDTKSTWRTCFLKQFGEWRYRNNFQYASNEYPFIESDSANSDFKQSDSPDIDSSNGERWLLTNGGGKDTLTGMLLLNEVGTPYDVFEGRTPIGGTIELQDQLLATLRSTVAPQSRQISVTITDNFYDRPAADFIDAGVEVDYFKTDFAVGHTANYVGFFPILLFHGYSRVWFNIEKSADDFDVIWNAEQISHEWCKSSEYQILMTSLFSELFGEQRFKGFASTLRGLHDTMIYRIACSEPDLLTLTHSCNYNKPWCAKCPKCCFCYLMMAANLGEEFAMKVLGVDYSLIEDLELQEVWTSLLNPEFVAWECVASADECALALTRFATENSIPTGLQRFAVNHDDAIELESRFNHVDWDAVPTILQSALTKLIRRSPVL